MAWQRLAFALARKRDCIAKISVDSDYRLDGVYV